MKITAAVARSPRQALIAEELEIDAPGDDEILVRIVAVGLCHTDIIARDQLLPLPLPSVLGHEGAGVVEHVGSKVSKVQPGDHVVLTYLSCGNCHHCQQGRPAYCREAVRLNMSGQRPGGGTTLRDQTGAPVCGCFFGQSSFASHAIANERNVVKVPKDVPLDILGPLGCGIQTGAGAVLNALNPPAGASIAIFGAGAVGLAATLAAIIAGCTKIIVVDIKQSRLDFALQLGATDVVNAVEQDSAQVIRNLTAGNGVQFSLECTGVSSVVRNAVDALSIGGVCGITGAAPSGTEISLDMNGLLFGRTVRGIIEGDSIPDIFIPKLIELWKQGRFPFDKLISFYRFADINTAIEDSKRGTSLKPVLRLE